MQEIIYCPGCRRQLSLPDDAIKPATPSVRPVSGRSRPRCRSPICPVPRLAAASASLVAADSQARGGASSAPRPFRRLRSAAETAPGRRRSTIAAAETATHRGGEILAFRLLAAVARYVDYLRADRVDHGQQRSHAGDAGAEPDGPRRRRPPRRRDRLSASPGCSCGRSSLAAASCRSDSRRLDSETRDDATMDLIHEFLFDHPILSVLQVAFTIWMAVEAGRASTFFWIWIIIIFQPIGLRGSISSSRCEQVFSRLAGRLPTITSSFRAEGIARSARSPGP